ncbi:MAG: hypothetical protein KDB61_09365 [Planctomycetes bacterium]|nr:hypothetical protein [Planctomycetota bacterium]
MSTEKSTRGAVAGTLIVALWVVSLAIGVCLLASCGSIDLNVKTGPAPEPSGLLEVRATAEMRGTVALYVGGELELPMYTIEGKFEAVARATFPPSIDIYLSGDAYVVPDAGTVPEAWAGANAHERAIASGRVRIYRDGVLLTAPQGAFYPGGLLPVASEPWVQPVSYIAPAEPACLDGSCDVPSAVLGR